MADEPAFMANKNGQKQGNIRRERRITSIKAVEREMNEEYKQSGNAKYCIYCFPCMPIYIILIGDTCCAFARPLNNKSSHVGLARLRSRFLLVRCAKRAAACYVLCIVRTWKTIIDNAL